MSHPITDAGYDWLLQHMKIAASDELVEKVCQEIHRYNGKIINKKLEHNIQNKVHPDLDVEIDPLHKFAILYTPFGNSGSSNIHLQIDIARLYVNSSGTNNFADGEYRLIAEPIINNIRELHIDNRNRYQEHLEMRPYIEGMNKQIASLENDIKAIRLKIPGWLS